MFKIGDVVVCVEAKYPYLTLGKEYVVVDNNQWCYVINDREHRAGYYLRRFKLKEQEKKLDYNDLYEQAKKLGIIGRGRMNKAELILAIDNCKNKPPAPKPVVESLGVQLRNKTGNNPGTCSYAYRTELGNKLHVRDVCHARLRSESPMLEIVLDVAGHYNNHPNKEAYEAFVMWMLVSSPFSSCFVTKDRKEAITTGLQLDVTKSHSNNVAAAIALRAGSEFEYRAILFHKLVSTGFSPYVAWIASAYFRRFAENEFTFFCCKASHDIHHGNIPTDVMNSFYKKGFLFSDGASNVKATQYTAVKSICGVVEYELEDNDRTLKNFLIKGAGVKEVGVGWEKSYTSVNTRSLYRVCEALEVAFK